MSEERYGDCPSCHATGVYRGTMEPEGVGVICSLCKGSGKVQSQIYPLFSGCRRRDDITLVFNRISDIRGTYIGQGVSYEEFLNGSMPDEEGTTQLEMST